MNFEQNNILAGLLRKLVGQLPLDDDLTPKNYDPIDPNKSVFCSQRLKIQEKELNQSRRGNMKTPLKPMSGAIMMGKISEQMKDVWVTHVQKHHSKHLVYQGINLNRRLLDMNLEIFS